jgi:hypothetical protein
MCRRQKLFRGSSSNKPARPSHCDEISKIKGFRTEEIARWPEKHLARDSYVVSDGLPWFRAVQDSGCEHEAIETSGGPSSSELEAF